MAAKQLFDQTAERGIIGAILQDVGALEAPDVAGLTRSDFQNEFLAAAFDSAVKHYRAGRIPDFALLAGDLAHFERANSMLVGLVNDGANILNAGELAHRIRDLADRRRALALTTQAATAIYNRNGDWRDHVAAAGVDLVQLDDAGKAESVSQRPKSSWTGAELLAATFPEPPWAVPGIIPVGLSFLAGRPKVGKSWLGLQMALAVDAGGMVLNQRVAAGKVLYLALEDYPRRLQGRLVKQHAPKNNGIRFEFTWQHADRGGLDDLRRALDAEQYRLVVIDTFSRFMGAVDQSDHPAMNKATDALQRLAVDHDLALVLIDHLRKPGPGEVEQDPVDALQHSTAKSANADAILGLQTQQGKTGATLAMRGRDIEDRSLALSWDALTFCWQYEGTAEEVALKGRKTDVLLTLRGGHPDPVTTSSILDLTSMKKGNLSLILRALIGEGLVKEHVTGKTKSYTLTDEGLRQSGGPVKRISAVVHDDDSEDDDS